MLKISSSDLFTASIFLENQIENTSKLYEYLYNQTLIIFKISKNDKIDG